jgi:hypothetical protein
MKRSGEQLTAPPHRIPALLSSIPDDAASPGMGSDAPARQRFGQRGSEGERFIQSSRDRGSGGASEGGKMDQQREPSGWAIGWITFAAFMMIMIGAFHVIAGLVALIDDNFYVTTKNYVLQFDTTTWGWIHLLVGILVALAGISLFSGAIWARTVGVILALISAIAGFAWLPYYPVWGIIIVAMAVSVVWALTAHGRDIGA